MPRPASPKVATASGCEPKPEMSPKATALSVRPSPLVSTSWVNSSLPPPKPVASSAWSSAPPNHEPAVYCASPLVEPEPRISAPSWPQGISSLSGENAVPWAIGRPLKCSLGSVIEEPGCSQS